MTCVKLLTSIFGFPLKNCHINMYHMHIWKKWITPCPGPWGCRSHGSPGPLTWLLSLLKPKNLDSHWKIGIWTCIICIFEKMNYSLSWYLGLPFSLFSLTLDMTFVRLVTPNSDSHWKIDIKTCIICMFEKNELLPVLVPGVAVLVVPLDPRYCLCHPWNLWIRILLEKVAYEHV